MCAKDAVTSCLYDLPARGQRPGYHKAECHGLNHTGQWVLFAVNGPNGTRTFVTILPTEQIQPVN